VTELDWVRWGLWAAVLAGLLGTVLHAAAAGSTRNRAGGSGSGNALHPLADGASRAILHAQTVLEPGKAHWVDQLREQSPEPEARGGPGLPPGGGPQGPPEG